MGVDVKTLALAKKYTRESMAGGGAVAGKNCTISSIVPITGGNRVTFQWTLDNGEVKTGTMDVMNGATGAQGPQGPAGADGQDGTDGLGIKSVAVNAQGHLIITYDDDTTEDAGEIQVTAAVDSVNGMTGDVTLTASDVGALPDDTEIPSKISDLTNDSDFIETSSTAGLVKNDGTIDTKTYVEAEAGKGLSTNDYDATAKAAVDALGTASSKDVAASGDASASEVVMGNDSRLTDARTPVAHTHTLSNISDAGTAAAKNSTASVTSGSTDLVESGAVHDAIAAAVTSAWHAGGAKTCAELTSALLIAANEGMVYNMSDTGTTTADFIEGAGKEIGVGSDVAVIKVGSAYKFNLLPGLMDLTNYIQKSNTSGLVKNDGSIDETSYATAASVTAITDGTTIDSFSDVETALSGKADTSDIPDITVKADKVNGATNGNFAGLDANGNLTDSGKKAADFATPTDVSNLESRSKSLLKDTVGWTGKNLVNAKIGDIYSYNGVSFVINDDGTVTANGTASGNAYFSIWGRNPRIPVEVLGIGNSYILSGDPNVSPDNKSYVYINYYNASMTRLGGANSGNNGSVRFTIPAQASGEDVKYIDVGVGILDTKVASNYIFYPMLRRADIEDDTYETHHESVDNALIDKEVYCGRNLLPLIKYSQTMTGVTFTVYEDGTVHTSGTSTGAVWFNICGGPNESVGFMKSLIPGNKYIYSGMPSNAPSGVDMTIWDTTDLCPRLNKDNLEQEFTVPDASYSYGARTNLSIGAGTSGVNFDGLIFRPSIRRADEVNSVFEPYHEAMNTAKVDRDVLKEVGAYNLADPDLATTTQLGFTLTRSTYKGKGVQYKLTGADTGESGCQFIIEDDAKFLAKMKQFTGKLLKLTGCPRVGADFTNGFFLAVYFNYDQGAGATVSFMDYGNGGIIRVPTSITSARLAITVRHNATPVNETIFRPMITPDLTAKYEDYAPYALTNQELTDGQNTLFNARVLRTQLANANPSGVIIGGCKKYDLYLIAYQINSMSSVGLMMLEWRYDDVAVMANLVGTASNIFTATLDTSNSTIKLKATGAAGGTQLFFIPYRTDGAYTFTPMTDFS